MKIKIKQVIDSGTHNSERVIFSVLEDCNLHYYILSDTTYTTETTISNKIRHIHWFNNKEVKKGDEVVLYTKKGTNTSEKLADGKIRYIIYWELDSSVWNNTGDAAILFNINTWNTTKAK